MTTPDPGRLARELETSLRAAGDPERARHEQRYLKSELDHVGASVPAIRRIATALRRAHPDLDRGSVLELAGALWARRIHECRMAAVELLDLYAGRLVAADLRGVVERLLREARTWAIVDGLAAHVAGGLVERFPALAPALDRWAEDDDFWIRRSALLAELVALREGRGDFERFGRHADALLEDPEFFIRKAIGWVLRDTSRRRPELVAAWLRPRAGRASGLTLREATKHLPEAERARLGAARGPRRRASPAEVSPGRRPR